MSYPPANSSSTSLVDILDRLTVRSLAGIRGAAQALQETGFAIAKLRTVVCSDIASNDPMVDGDGWILPALALTSALTLACRYESEPFWCNRTGIHTQQCNPHLVALDLTDFIETAIVAVAIVIPIHLPYGQIGAVGFQPVDSDRDDLTREFLEYGDLLGLFAHKFIASYVKVMDKQRWLPPDMCLSECEIECLRWAAVGKSDGEIATMLSRSCATIRFHIHNAALKLNAVNRSHTVLKAGRLGFLGTVSSESSSLRPLALH